VFLEEAQNLKEAGLFVKGLVDAHRNLDILVTGSSSYHLQARTRESLAGRAVRRRILPLSLGELIDFPAPPTVAGRPARAMEIQGRQLLTGSYPGVWFALDRDRALSDLLEAFIIRDASDRFRIRLSAEFRRLLRLAAGQVGQLVNASEWASILGVSSPTVQEWLSLLEECWIIQQVPPFAGGKRIEVTGARKVHFFDLGIRNMLLGQLGPDIRGRPDRGALFEGWAFSELSKVLPFLWTLHYWRTKGGAEMDFVLTFGERVIGVETEAGPHRRLSRSVRAFIDAYAPEAIFIASGDGAAAKSEQLKGTQVHFVPLYELPARIAEMV
jgi:predicted AAA+ superfamily ATPase